MNGRARAVLRYIVAAYKKGGPLPIYQEIADYFEWSKATSFNIVAEIEEAGAIKRKLGSWRYGLVLAHPEVTPLVEGK